MIRWFSGTGNTAAVARLLARELGIKCEPFSAADLLNPETVHIDSDNDFFIWAFPTYSWGVPPVIVDIITNCTFSTAAAEARHIMLTTCGDDMALANSQFRRLIKERGLKCGGVFCVQMPNNYVGMKGFDVDTPEVERAKLDAFPSAVARVADAIRNSGDDILIRKPWKWIKSRIIYPWFCRYAMTTEPFHTTDACISCGKCEQNCPMENIALDTNGRPEWGDECAMCLRCYHICPQRAIRYGKATDKTGQYQTELKSL